MKKCGIKEKSDTERKTKGLVGHTPDLSAHPLRGWAVLKSNTPVKYY